MSKIPLNNVGSLIDATTAATTINNNWAAITTAFNNTISRDGSSPNEMSASFDMNSNRILNLPVATAAQEPITKATFDAALIGSGNVPSGGTTGQFLVKASNTSFDTTWSSTSVVLTAGTNISIAGLTISTIASPTFSGGVSSPLFKVLGATSGFTQFVASAVAAGSILLPPNSTTMMGTDLTQIVTNKSISGSTNTLTNIGNGSLVNSSVTMGSTTISLGSSSGTLTGVTLSGTTFVGALTLPTPFTLGATSVTTTGTQLNYLNAATGTTGTTSTNVVFSTNPTLVTPTLGVATVTTVNKVTVTAPASAATLTIPDGVTLTGPASSGTAMTLGNTETITGVKTFGSAGAVGRFKLAGTTSGTTILDASATASGTLTLPAATDTLIGKTTTDTLTNKTYDTAGTGNSFSINSVAVTANTGTGAVARATSPTFVTPALGTVAAGSVLTNATGLPLTTGVTGTLPVANGGTNYTGGTWTSYSPTITGTGGTYTSSGTSTFLQIGKIVFVSVALTLTVATGAPTQASVTYPTTPVRSVYLLGRDNGTGKMCVWRSSDGVMIAYDNTTPSATNTTFIFSGSYETT